MSKTNELKTTNLPESDIVTELQESNRKLLEKLQFAEQDKDITSAFVEEIAIERLNDLRNLLFILPNVKNGQSSILNALHCIVDDLMCDMQLIAEQCYDALQDNYEEEKEKVYRGCQTKI